MKKLILTLVIVAFCIIGLVACDSAQETTTTHTHNYATVWETNDSEHWHECQNDDCDAKKIDVNEHIDNNDDGKCDVCNYIIHTHTLVLVPMKSATCTENGHFDYYTCSGCDKWFYDDNGENEIVDKTSVVWLSFHYLHIVPAVDATCTENGNIVYYTCGACEKWFSDENGENEITDKTSIVVFAKGHNLTLVPAVDAICTENGSTAYYTCSDCEKWFSDEKGTKEITDKNSVVILKSGHDFNGVFCTLCGKTETEGLVYTDKIYYYEVSGIGTATDTDIFIPKEYNGKAVTSIGDSAFKGCSNLTNLYIGNSVTSIQDSAFSDCSGLKSVSIPDSVTSIGWRAFENCTGLTSIIIPDSITSIGVSVLKNTAYFNTESNWENGLLYNGNHLIYANYNIRGDYVIKDGTITIGEGVFSGCDELTSIIIPESVTSIGSSAFSYCSSLTSITIPNKVTSIGFHAFSNCSGLKSITIPNKVTRIGEEAFKNCTGLTSITIPNSVEYIGSSAFANTAYYNDKSNWENDVLYIGNHLIDAEKNISGDYILKDGTITIGGAAFSDCSGLTSVSIPDSLISIGSSAFSRCSGLTNVIIGNSVTYIGYFAFSNCSSLSSVTMGNSVTWLDDFAFAGCKSLTSISIPDSVKSIGRYAFESCIKLTSIKIPNSVTHIGCAAFSGCNGLINIDISNNERYCIINGILYNKEVTALISAQAIKGEIIIPNTVTYIDVNSFDYCYGLTSITIPDSVTSIGDYAFYGCSDLLSINVDENNPNYCSINGVLYDKNATTLLFAPEGIQGEIEIPNSVTQIEGSAFRFCSSLTSVIIPDSVTSIDFSAFYDCENLTIYCEAESQPSGWDSEWNSSNCPVIWGYKG